MDSVLIKQASIGHLQLTKRNLIRLSPRGGLTNSARRMVSTNSSRKSQLCFQVENLKLSTGPPKTHKSEKTCTPQRNRLSI